MGSPPFPLSRHRRSLAGRSGTFYDYFAEIYIFWHQRYCFASTNQTDKGGHLSLIAPSSVSFSTRDGTFGGPQFFPFSSAESQENCLYFKVAPVINDKKTSKASCCDQSSACDKMNMRSTELSPKIFVLIETIKERWGGGEGAGGWPWPMVPIAVSWP